MGDQIVAEAKEKTPAGEDPFAHAELDVVRQACQILGVRKLTDAVLYTTAKPCFMCTFAIRAAQIPRVVIGCSIPSIGGASSEYPILTAPDVEKWGDPPEIVWGVMEHECSELLKK